MKNSKYNKKGTIIIISEAPKYCLFLDRDVISNVNYKKKDLTCVLAILLEYYKQRSIYGDNIVKIGCTVSSLWLNIVWSVKPSRRDKENFINSLNRLVENNLVRIEQTNEDDITWNSMLILNIQNLVHSKERTFIKFDSSDLDSMIEIDYNTLTLMLQVYINITSYFDMSQIAMFDECIENNEHPLDYHYDLYSENTYHVSCWAGHKRLMTTKHGWEEPSEQWISKPTLIKVLNLLEELNLIAIVKPQYKNSNENFTNHYCFPRHKKYVQHIADMMAKRQIYMRDEAIKESKNNKG